MSRLRCGARLAGRDHPPAGENARFAVPRRRYVEVRTMIPRILLAAALTLGLLSPGLAADPAKTAPPSQKLIVHEWGTFLGVQGSDGSTLGGMVASEEALPQ